MRALLFLILCFNFSFAVAQEINKGIDPPGTLQLTENLFIDKSPVTNLMFLEYLTMKDYLQSERYSSWKTYYIDKNYTEWRGGPIKIYSSLLNELESKNSRVSRRGYFEDWKYKDSPVLRITKAQAEDYCQWRTEMVEYAWNYFPKYAHQKDYADKIEYRLPSLDELEEAQIYFFKKDQLVDKSPFFYFYASCCSPAQTMMTEQVAACLQ